jgi:hypothetical protein
MPHQHITLSGGTQLPANLFKQPFAVYNEMYA